ncbi:MAG: ABC transporter ATP-binding protein [Firmicutes bacterium]|nr:ABC transporter ATP-binding protein [Bacillota bacterium]
MLKVENINCYYGAIHAVKDVSFEVKSGEIITLIGANGAGKSTILKTISGMMRSKTGSITFEGNNISSKPEHKLIREGLSHVPEGRRIFLQLTVEENLAMGAYTKPRSSISGNIARVYDIFPRLKERRRQIAGTLSGGEQQMLAIGRAIMAEPKLIMMDEPSMGLAPLLVNQIFEIIIELNKQGTTILLVEQNARMALKIASRAYVLETGRIVLSGSSGALLSDDSVKRAYLGG